MSTKHIGGIRHAMTIQIAIMVVAIQIKTCASFCCMHDYDCGEGKYCCKETNVPSYYELHHCNNTCVGTPCKQHTDCALPHECCSVEGVCSLKSDSCPVECNHHYDCDNKRYCCVGQNNQSHYCNESCPANPDYKDDCSLWGDCTQRDKLCCTKEADVNSTCTRNCTGNICRKDEDCAWPDECCGQNWRCKTANCTDECKDNWDCIHKGDEYCCKIRLNLKNICVQECVGQPCEFHHDCAFHHGECCHLKQFCISNGTSCQTECAGYWDCQRRGHKMAGGSTRKYCCSSSSNISPTTPTTTSETPFKYCSDRHCPNTPTHHERPVVWQEKKKPPKELAVSPSWKTTLITLAVFFLLCGAFIVWRYITYLKSELRRTKYTALISYDHNDDRVDMQDNDDHVDTHDSNDDHVDIQDAHVDIQDAHVDTQDSTNDQTGEL